MNIRVILADDHPVVIFGVRQMLGATRGISVVSEATTPKMLMDRLERVPCDVLVTDFSMRIDGSPDGLVMLKSICSRFPDLQVIVLTVLENPGLVKSMVRAGVVAVVHKSNDLMRLPEVVTAAYQRRLSRLHLEAWGFAAEGGGEPENSVSPRELEVIRHFASGKAITEIGQHLNRSIKTVSTQKSNAMRKLGVTSDVELFIYAQEHGLVP